MMKKKMIKTTAILLAASMVLTGTAVTASAQETSLSGVTSGTGEASVKTMAVKKKVRKKSVTMKVGKKKTIKVKTKKASIKTSNKKVVSVKKKKVGKNKYKYTLKAKKTGTATVTYKKGNRKIRLKVTVRKTGETGESKNAGSGTTEYDNAGSGTTEYHYEAYCLLDETYTNSVIPFYFRTDNPGDFGGFDDWYVYITDENGDKATYKRFTNKIYGDISYTSTYYLNASGGKVIYEYPPVSDGTIFSIAFYEVGTYTIHFVENETGNEYETCYDFTIDNDYTACQTEFINSVIEEVTTDDMSNSEKMTAISHYLYNLFSYFPNYIGEDGDSYPANLTTEYLPWYVNYYVDSYTSPDILVRFANAIGYENCRSLYGDSNYDQDFFHYYMICDDDGLLYQCCPSTSTGLLEGVSSSDDIPKIDLSSYQLN